MSVKFPIIKYNLKLSQLSKPQETRVPASNKKVPYVTPNNLLLMSVKFSIIRYDLKPFSIIEAAGTN